MIMKPPTSAEDYIEWNTDENDKKYVCVLGVSHLITVRDKTIQMFCDVGMFRE